MTDRLQLTEIEVGFRRPLVTAAGTLSTRRSIIVGLDTGTIVGWSEAPVFPSGRFGTAQQVWDDLTAPEAWNGGLPSVPLARAAFEAAVADAAAREHGLALHTWLGASGDATPARHPIGLLDPTALDREVAWLETHGITALKVKIAPGRDATIVESIRAALPDIDIAVDANGAYTDSMDPLWDRLEAAGVSFVEQPFAAEDLESHAALTSSARFVVCLDESLDEPERVLRGLEMGAAGALSVKLNRHGLARLMELRDAAAVHGVDVMIGGTFDTSIGRRHLLAAASLPGVVDAAVGPPGAYLIDDIAPYPMLEGGRIRPEDSPGIGAIPDVEAMDRISVRHAVVALRTDADLRSSVR